MMSISKKKLGYWGVLITSLILSVGLIRNIFHLLKSQERIDEAKNSLREVEAENRRLKNQKRVFESQEFVEKEVRDKLFMAKENEAVVILPPEIKDLKDEIINPKTQEAKPNWKKWLEVFWF